MALDSRFRNILKGGVNMESIKNKIYVRLDKNNIVIKLFSNVFEEPKDTDILIEEGNEEYHAHVHLKYQFVDSKDRYNYKYENGQLIELTEEEKDILFPPQKPQPTSQDILNSKLLKDNANRQLELNKQKQLNADLLLKIAKLGGNI
jgi:hypothetical protein